MPGDQHGPCNCAYGTDRIAETDGDCYCWADDDPIWLWIGDDPPALRDAPMITGQPASIL